MSKIVSVLVIGKQYARSDEEAEEKSKGENGWE